MFRKLLLDLYHKSGFGQSHRGTIHADSEKNVPKIISPALSILGESNPYTLYNNLTEDMIREGLLSRFTIIHYDGPSVNDNDNHGKVAPDTSLINRICDVVQNCINLARNNRVETITIDYEADELLKAFRAKCKRILNQDDTKATNELWNRAHLKALKISGVLAVGNNHFAPIVTKEIAEWAINLTNYEVSEMVDKFDRGEIGDNVTEMKQLAAMTSTLKWYVTTNFDKVKSYTDNEAMHADKIIPYVVLSKRLTNNSAMKSDVSKVATNGIKRTIQTLLDRGDLVELPKQEVTNKYHTGQKAYAISDKIFNE
jgi:hypothetical protein